MFLGGNGSEFAVLETFANACIYNRHYLDPHCLSESMMF